MSVWVGGEENAIHFTRNADGSRMALPVAGKFLTKVFADGSLGVERTDRFERSDEEPDYSCEIDITQANEQSTDVSEDIFFGGEEDFF
jgi:penicillin-binding protein 1A